MVKKLKTLHGNIKLPTFFPDGTRGVVKGVDSRDLENAKVEGLVINTYHLLVSDMGKKMEKFSGIHKLMDWEKPIITDSGGFQVMSLVHKNPELGKIKDEGVVFKFPGGPKLLLTPEKSIQTQLELGTDIAIVLDDCTYPHQSLVEQKKSVERTIAWAKRSKEEFVKISKARPCSTRPRLAQTLLFAVIQGGTNKKLRKYCAEELIKIGFDGYCFGGFPVDSKGKFLSGILEYVAQLLPNDKPKYALGVGRPENIVECVKLGYEIFDCVIPTREARHQKLYVYSNEIEIINLNKKNFYDTIYIGSGKYQNDPKPISDFCDCYTCHNYSKAYLHHLFKIADSLSIRLATIHNLRFYSMLLGSLRK